MAVDGRIQSFMRKLEEELEDESSFDRLLQQEEEMEAASFGLAEMETPSGRCPADNPYVIRGFNQYSDDVQLLPAHEQAKLGPVASEIVRSQSGAPGVTPVTQVVVVGHADQDVARERREPGFLQFMSEKRALTIKSALFCKAAVKSVQQHLDVEWAPVGRGARAMAVPAPRTEFERRCNRRVEIILVRTSPPPPGLDPTQSSQAAKEYAVFLPFYTAALQGTSGQFENPQLAEKKAREIADRIYPFLAQREQKYSGTPGCEDPLSYSDILRDAIQGTASKFSDPDVVVRKAAEVAEATYFGTLQETRKLAWKYALLPKPMGPDCEPVRGKVPGPANHMLCRTHGHILDTNTKSVIVHDLDEYKRRPRR
jgi:hypothetical protein